MRRLVIVSVVVILSLALMLGGCAKQAPAPQPTPSPTAAPAPKPAPSPTAAPAPKTESAADFYKNNILTLIVPFAPGGGHDFVGRLFVAAWHDVTGGFAKVENIPGGGAIVGSNACYKAKPDGLTLEVLAGGTLCGPQIFADPARQYKIEDFGYVGAHWYEADALLIGAKLPYKSMADLQKAKELKFSSPSGRMDWPSALPCEIFGLDGKVITGYKSGDLARLAIIQGEVTGSGGALSSFVTSINQGLLKAILTLGPERDPASKDLPTIEELVKPTAEQARALQLYRDLNIGRLFFTSPGVSPDRLQFLRDTFMKVAKSDAFTKNAVLVLNPLPEPWDYKKVEATLNRVKVVSKADIDNFNRIINKYVVK